MKGNEIPGPIRDENPCRFCTDERHAGCHDTCERREKWLAEIRRVKENRDAYYKRLGNRIKRDSSQGGKNGKH